MRVKRCCIRAREFDECVGCPHVQGHEREEYEAFGKFCTDWQNCSRLVEDVKVRCVKEEE